MFKKYILLASFLISGVSFSQNNTSSPYSIFGLGIENKTSSAGLNGLGNTGIAVTNPLQINFYNPASLGNVKRKSFLYEFGVNGVFSTIQTDGDTNQTNDVNLSHIALAFPVSNNFGIGAGLLPYTKVGYSINVDQEVQGTSETFTTFTTGSGGLNEFYLSSGVKLGKVVSVGLQLSYLFGSVDELTQLFNDVLFTFTNENHYTGMKLSGGFQYSFPNNKTHIGGTFDFNTFLNGTQNRTAFITTNNGVSQTIENTSDNELDQIELPLSFGIGISTEVYKDFTANFDLRKAFWENTKQTVNEEVYTNQTTYAFGLEYDPSVNNLKYWNKLKYRLGFNYDTGFIKISDQQIDSYFVSAGLGIPINKTGMNNLNISYSYGTEGTVTRSLIQENFHKLTLNLNFVGNWFKERKIF